MTRRASSATGDRLLKAKTSVLLQATGGVTFVEVQVPTQSRKSHRERVAATDLDVLSVRFNPDLGIARTFAECKSGERDAIAELYKLAGVVAGSRAEQTMLVRAKVGAHVREVARGLNVWVLDEAELDSLLHAWVPGAAAAVAGEMTHIETLLRISADIGKRHRVETAVILHEHWHVDDGRAIASIVKAVSNIANAGAPDSAEQCILCVALATFAIRVLRFAGMVMRLYASDPEQGSRIQLAGSVRLLRERESIAKIVSGLLPDGQSARVTGEPEYFPELAELALRLYRSAPTSHRVPEVLDSYARWAIRGGNDSDFPQLVTSANREAETTIKLAQDLAVSLVKWGGLPANTFRHLLAL